MISQNQASIPINYHYGALRLACYLTNRLSTVLLFFSLHVTGSHSPNPFKLILIIQNSLPINLWPQAHMFVVAVQVVKPPHTNVLICHPSKKSDALSLLVSALFHPPPSIPFFATWVSSVFTDPWTTWLSKQTFPGPNS